MDVVMRRLGIVQIHGMDSVLGSSPILLERKSVFSACDIVCRRFFLYILQKGLPA